MLCLCVGEDLAGGSGKKKGGKSKSSSSGAVGGTKENGGGKDKAKKGTAKPVAEKVGVDSTAGGAGQKHKTR